MQQVVLRFHLLRIYQEIQNQLYENDLDKYSFIERLEHIIKPVYKSAQILGFKEWVYGGLKL